MDAQSMPVTESIFIKLVLAGQLFVAGICTKFNKNSTNFLHFVDRASCNGSW